MARLTDEHVQRIKDGLLAHVTSTSGNTFNAIMNAINLADEALARGVLLQDRADDLATARELLEEAREWMLGRANAHAEQSPPGPCICDWCVTCRRIAAFLAGPEARP